LLASIINSSDEAIYSVNLDSIITSWNRGASILFGYSAEEAVGRKITMLIAPDRQLEELGIITRIIRGEFIQHFETERRKKDGAVIHISLNVAPILDADQRITGTSRIVRDITELKNAKHHISGLNISLEHKVSQRTKQLAIVNRELEAFTYSVSHDLRAPLRIIDGFADILVTDYGAKLDPEGIRILGVIVTNARRMGQLIDDLLDLSRLGRQEIIKSMVDMNKLVNSAIDEQLPLYENKQPNISCDQLLPASCDSGLMLQVWGNLISNALKYSGKQEKPTVHIGSYRDGNRVVYSVKDNGVGFDMKYADKLFGVFQRLHKLTEFEGTGVGLALVHRIVVKHGGNVWAESEPAMGATFFFSLPAKKNL
jgi:PAS domain S-box-containing protein